LPFWCFRSVHHQWIVNIFSFFENQEPIFVELKKTTNVIAFLGVSDQYMISETLIFSLFLDWKIFSFEKSTNFISFLNVSDQYMINQTVIFLAFFLRTKKYFRWIENSQQIVLLFWMFQISTYSVKRWYFYFFKNEKIFSLMWKKSTNFIAFWMFQISTWPTKPLIFLLFLRNTKIFSLRCKNQHILLLFWMFQISTRSIKRWYFYFFWEPRNYFRRVEKIDKLYCFFECFGSVHDRSNVDIFTFLRTKKIFLLSWKNQQILLLFWMFQIST